MNRVLAGIGAAALVAAGIAQSSCATGSPRLSRSSQETPRSVDQAVQILKDRWLKKQDRDWILRNPKDVVTVELHLPFGTAVRNNFGLWGRNAELLASCGVQDAEACSGVIFDRLWESIRADSEGGLVQRLDCQFALVEQLQIKYTGFFKLRIGEIVTQMGVQIDRQLEGGAARTAPGCEAALNLRLIGRPNLSCWSRAEFSEDGRDPVSLQRFLGWFSWRNGFRVKHSPPALDLEFEEKCAWPQRPTWFEPGNQAGRLTSRCSRRAARSSG